MPIRDGETLAEFEARLQRMHAEPPAPTHVNQMTPAQLERFEAENNLNGRSLPYAPPPIPTERRERAAPKAIPDGHALDWTPAEHEAFARANGLHFMIPNRY